jgi:hypothetical protein
MTRQHAVSFVPRFEVLEERCVPTVVTQPAANSVLVTTGSSQIAIHEFVAGGASFVEVTGAGRGSGQALPLSGPFQIGVSFQTTGMHQINFFHAPGTPVGTVLASVGSGPVMRTARADIKVEDGVIHSALLAGSHGSSQIVLNFVPTIGGSVHTFSPIVVQTVDGLRFRHRVFVGVVLPVSPEFGFATVPFFGTLPAGVWPFLGASPNPFDRGFVVPASVLPGLFFSGFTPFTSFAFVNPFFNPFNTFL